MAKTKISEFDTNPALNTDIDSINIAEGCAPSGINNAIRELMSQLKDQQTGASGDSFSVGGNLTVLAQGDVRLSDADSSNYVALQAPTTLAANYTLTLPTATGTAAIVPLCMRPAYVSWSTLVSAVVSSSVHEDAAVLLAAAACFHSDGSRAVDCGTINALHCYTTATNNNIINS